MFSYQQVGKKVIVKYKKKYVNIIQKLIMLIFSLMVSSIGLFMYLKSVFDEDSEDKVFLLSLGLFFLLLGLFGVIMYVREIVIYSRWQLEIENQQISIKNIHGLMEPIYGVDEIVLQGRIERGNKYVNYYIQLNLFNKKRELSKAIFESPRRWSIYAAIDDSFKEMEELAEVLSTATGKEYRIIEEFTEVTHESKLDTSYIS
ncbi:hypothetical protein R9C00_22640 [Flammeovirgaceae bacterium SG7u.111]|nr:hypothetical protein [Flammeovirgaceae bacterium SG7u.132]WPO34502.1 hypothetical protein R9C00_22640 [Flammeovirgaceae bacterium SG7u.111]